MKHKSTLEKLLDLVINDDPGVNPTRKLATFFIILSGIMLYLDKIFLLLNITLPMPRKFENASIDFFTFLWMASATFFSPIFMIIGFSLKPYKISTLVPIYCVSLQGYFVLLSGKLVEDSIYLYAYSFVTAIIIFVIIEYSRLLAQKYVSKMIKKEKERIRYW